MIHFAPGSLAAWQIGLVLAASGSLAIAGQVDRAAILEGVREIAAPGVPGAVVVTGLSAAPLIVGDYGDKLHAAVVAAAEIGTGRIVAFGHDGYFGSDALKTADTGRLLFNAVKWAGHERAAVRVGVLDLPDALAFLQAGGVGAVAVNANDNFANFDVLVLTHAALPDAVLPRFAEFLQRGGGLVIASCAWGWCQITGRPIAEHPGNRIAAPAGIVWTDAMLERNSPRGFDAATSFAPVVHAGDALTFLTDSPTTAPADVGQAVAAALLAARSVPADDTVFLPRTKGLRATAGVVVPTEKLPITAQDGLRRLALGLDVVESQSTSREKIKAHPAAADFPGAVGADAPMETRTIKIDLARPRWHSTALYAPAGALVTIQIPPVVANRGLFVRIGAHTDELWHLKDWQRAPAISRAWPLKSELTTVASAFGGLIYIDVPEGVQPGEVDATISGAVAAPYFELGQTDPGAWRETIRSAPGPWAELAGRLVIFTVPSEAIRNLNDPTPVLEFWDSVVAAEDRLAAWRPGQRTSPERIVCDRQISAGYMHSGYPIVTPIDDSMRHALDIVRLRGEASWGHFHELGHNHQVADWTFDGTVEVTCNLFSMYVTEKILGAPFDSGHPAIRDRAARLGRVRQHLAAGAPFDKWKSDPFLALSMYIQLIDAFGWQPFEEVFAEYRDLPEAERPQNDDARRDQWLVRFSRRVGRNLGPFFEKWGVPTSAAARDSISKLPVWLPKELE